MLSRKFSNWLIVALLCVLPAAAQTVVRAGTTAVPWASNISCSPGQFVAASPDNLHVFKAVNLTPGTAGNTQPTWNIFSGAITTDGSCAWQEQGTLGLPGAGGSQSGPPQTLTNCTAAGTTLNEGVQFSTQLINGVTSLCGTTATAGSISVVGVCQTGCGNAGAAQIAYSGYQPGIFDNQTTQNDYVIPSATNPGQFTDIGATVPASTTENVGIVASTNTGPGTIATIFLAPLSLLARGSSGGSGVVNPPGCANGIAYYPGLGAVISSDCNFTTNGQGDFTAHSGTFNDILHAGYVNFIQGPAPPTAPSNGIQIAAPTSVTGHTLYLPGSAQTGCATWGTFAGQPQLQGTGVACGAGGGGSVGLALPSIFTVTNSPVISTGTLTGAFNNPGADYLPTGTAANLIDWKQINSGLSCGDSTHAVSYDIVTHTFGCQAIGSTIPQALNPTAPTAVVNGTPATTDYKYVVVGCEDGPTCAFHSAATSATDVPTGAATLTSVNSITLKTFADTLYGYRCYNIYRTAAAGTPSTTGLIGNCVWKSFIDTGLAGDSTTAPATNTTVLDANGTTAPLPGCNKIFAAPWGIDGPPCTGNILDDEFTWGNGTFLPGDANDPFWTRFNFGTTTLTLTQGELVMVPQTAAAITLRGATQTAPATPWSFVEAVWFNPTISANLDQQCGIVVYDGTKLETLGYHYTSAGQMRLEVARWTTTTAFSSSPATSGIVIPPAWIYLKVQNDGTNLNYFYSYDGIEFGSAFFTTPKGTFLANQNNVGFFCEMGSTSANPHFVLDWFRRTQ